MTAFHLVTCEASFTLTAVEGTLVRTVHSQTCAEVDCNSHNKNMQWSDHGVVAVGVGRTTSVLRWILTLIYILTHLPGTADKQSGLNAAQHFLLFLWMYLFV